MNCQSPAGSLPPRIETTLPVHAPLTPVAALDLNLLLHYSKPKPVIPSLPS